MSASFGRVWPFLLLLACLAPTPALAQRDVGPARVALFAGARLASPSAALLGLAGELELKQTWTLAAGASLTEVQDGRYARYELDGRWRPAREGALRPYLGAGVALARSSAGSAGGPMETRVAGLALAGCEVGMLGTTAFAEVVGVQAGSLTVEARGGVRLLVFAQ